MLIKSHFGVYHIDISIKGRRVRKSLQTTDKVKARELHDKIKAKLWDELYLDKKDLPLWEDCVKLWKHHKSNKKSFHKDYAMIKYLDKYFKEESIDKLNIEEALSNKDVTPTTKNRYKALFKSMLKLCKLELNLDITLPNIRLNKELPREEYLTKSEYELLRRNLPDQIQCVAALAVETGLRLNNILTLKKSNVDLESKTLSLASQQMKSNKPVTLPLSDKAISILKRCDFRFRFNTSDYYEFKKAAKKIGKPSLRFHDLRHTFATWKAQEGVPLDIISRLLGHSSIRTTERYRHLCVNDLRKYV